MSDTATVTPNTNTAKPAPKVGHPSYAELQAKIAALEKALANKLRFTVSEKGAILISGLRRYPIALYLSELNAIFENMQAIRTFVASNPANKTTGVGLSHGRAGE